MTIKKKVKIKRGIYFKKIFLENYQIEEKGVGGRGLFKRTCKELLKYWNYEEQKTKNKNDIKLEMMKTQLKQYKKKNRIV